MSNELEQDERDAIAEAIKNGCTSGRIDNCDDNSKVSWELKTEKFSD